MISTIASIAALVIAVWSICRLPSAAELDDVERRIERLERDS